MIYNDDCLTVLNKINKNSIDLIVTSPPYNLDINYDSNNDKSSYDEYLRFTSKWLIELLKVSKADGRMCLNVPLDTNKNGKQSVYSDILALAKEIGWKYHTTIIWNEQNISRRTAWGCIPIETHRIMTNNGLKYFKDFDKENDLVATINPNTKKLEYQKAYDIICYSYNGKVFKYKNHSDELVFTPNHRILDEDFSPTEIKKINSSQRTPKYHNGWDGNENNIFLLPRCSYGKRTKKDYIDSQKEIPVKMKDWVAFLGLVFTNGNVYHSPEKRQYKVSIYQIKKTHFNEIENLLKRLPFSFTYKESKGEFYCCSKQLTQYLYQYKNSVSLHHLPDFLFELDESSIEEFIHWFAVGDGSIREGIITTICIHTKQTELIKGVLELLLKSNFYFRCKNYVSRGNRFINKDCFIKNECEMCFISIHKKGIKKREFYYIQKNRLIEEDFDGNVWCVSTKNGTILIENNGFFMWTGNSWKSASAPYVTAPVEVIIVMYKEFWKKQNKGESTISRDNFIAWTNGVWTFNGEKKKNVGGHPAAFPIELPKRCIELFSYNGDIILDPFMGSGTTCVAAKALGRNYIGIDISENYCKFVEERLKKV